MPTGDPPHPSPTRAGHAVCCRPRALARPSRRAPVPVTPRDSSSLVAIRLTLLNHLLPHHSPSLPSTSDALPPPSHCPHLSRSRSLVGDSYFITSKVPGGLNASATIAAHQLTLSQLGLKYVDLLLIHFPTTMTASPVGSKAMRQEQWKGMEALHKQGLARSIGVSHFCQRHVEDVLEIATVKVAVNQVQYHVGMGPAGNQANDDRSFDEKMGILYQSFSPLCGPCGTSELINGKLVTSIGAAHNKTGAQVSLKWLVQQGIPVIPKSSVESHLKENIDLFDWELTQSEMDALSAASTPAVAGGDPGPPATSGDCTLP